MDRKAFWQGLMKAAAKVAVYASEHPDQVKFVVDEIAAAKK